MVAKLPSDVCSDLAMPENVMCRDAIPQFALLASPKTRCDSQLGFLHIKVSNCTFSFRLFVTHFGGVGTMEAIWTAVPMVGMALEGDQGNANA